MNLKITEAEATSVEGLLGALRRQGWRVAVHNDFSLKNQLHTFWLLNHPASNRFVRGEATSDIEALLLCCANIRLLR